MPTGQNYALYIVPTMSAVNCDMFSLLFILSLFLYNLQLSQDSHNKFLLHCCFLRVCSLFANRKCSNEAAQMCRQVRAFTVSPM